MKKWGYSITPHFYTFTPVLKMSQSKSWIFTINNPHTLDIPKKWKDVEYAIWQLEEGTEGTRHLQGYVVFCRRKKIATLKKVDVRAHWEIRRGTHAQAKEYSSKVDTRKEGPWTVGTDTDIPEKQGTRSDLLEVKKAIDEGKDEVYLVDTHFGVCAKHMRFFRDYKRIKTAPRTEKTHVRVLWGPTGTGKSKYCAAQHPTAYWKPQGQWWCGYTGQDVVIIDEFYGWLTYSFLLRLLDRYPLIVETKGGQVAFTAKTIILTSNKHPKEWYDAGRHPYAPLERRIDECVQYPIATPSVDECVTTTTTTTTRSTDPVVPHIPTPPRPTEWDTDSDEERLQNRAWKPPAKVYPRTGTHIDHSWQSPQPSPPPSPVLEKSTLNQEPEGGYTRAQIRKMEMDLWEDENYIASPGSLFKKQKK